MLKEMWVKFWTPNVKRWVISTLVTFFSGFGLSLSTNLQNLDLSTLENGILVGVVFAGIRAGLKAIVEGWVVYRRRDA